MGKHKTKIDRIKNTKIRHLTFYKRKKGLLKKAMELSAMCDVHILLCIFNSNMKRCAEFTTLPFNNLVQIHNEMSGREISIFSPSVELNSKGACNTITPLELFTDEEKKMRSAELYNKFNNTKIKFTGENSKHISKSLVKNSDAFNKSALDYQHNNSFSNQFNQKQTSSIKVYEDTHQKILYNSEDLLSESMDEESKDSLFVNNCSNNMKISIKTKANKFKKRNSCSSGSESNNYELSEESKRNEEFLIDENRKEYNKDTLITFQKLQTTKAIPNLDMKSRTKNQNVKFMTLDDNKGYNINENTIIELQNEQRKNSQKWIDSCECKKNGEIHNKISLANDCKSDVDNQEIEEIRKLNRTNIDQAHADCLEHYKVFKIELRNKNKEKKRECKLKRKLNNNLLDVCNESKPSTRFSGASIENIPYTGNIQVHEKERDHDLLSFIEENEEKIEDHHISPCSNNIQESDVHLQSNIANHKISHEESITIQQTRLKEDLDKLNHYYQISCNFLSCEDHDNPFIRDPVSQPSSPAFNINVRYHNFGGNIFDHN